MRINLLEIVDYLREHHDMMFVLPGKDGALVWDPAINEVTVIWGDFHGTPEENVAEARLALQRGHAWLN